MAATAMREKHKTKTKHTHTQCTTENVNIKTFILPMTTTSELLFCFNFCSCCRASINACCSDDRQRSFVLTLYHYDDNSTLMLNFPSLRIFWPAFFKKCFCLSLSQKHSHSLECMLLSRRQTIYKLR